MNNEKLILKALRMILLHSDQVQKVQSGKIGKVIEDIEKALNPKEDVPYGDSLEKRETYTCNECGFKSFTTEGRDLHIKLNHKKELAKSSREGKKQ